MGEIVRLAAPQLWGIVNITEDSFSDGGRFLAPEAALAHARALRAAGADVIDLGAASSNPDGKDVSVEEELARLSPVLEALVAEGACVSVDTVKPDVMRAVLAKGAAIINDVSGFRSPEAVRLLVDFPRARAVVMFAAQAGPRAPRTARAVDGLLEEILGFFHERLDAFAAAGVERARLIVDPGMGFFLGSNPEPSLHVLKHLPALAALDVPVLVSTTRKSFIGEVLGGRPPDDRAAGTLATELWALSHGASHVRTHDVRQLADAWRLWQAVGQTP